MTGNTEKHSFQAEIKQLLNIVVNSLYSNEEIFVRELISNGSDALDKLRFAVLNNNATYGSDPDLKIVVKIDKANRTITFSDNGIGMTRDEAMANLGTIAQSGTRNFLAHMTGDQKKDAHLIGQFGVGFYSAFIVADKVQVQTLHADSDAKDAVLWESTGDGEYEIATIEKAQRGTDVILHLKADKEDFLEEYRMRSIITKYSDHLNVPILMAKLDDKGAATDEFETVNKATALWTLPKSSITDEQYKEFYKHISHDYEDPLAWTQHKVEGKIDYTCLLYVPNHAPFDLWQRDAHHGLKLYVQRVFIMDQVEQFLPSYLRFMRGVLDTTSLPLNISREILQDHPVIGKLKSALVRHTLDLLDRLAKDEPEKYAHFWKEFGNVLKEGPAEDFANRERVSKLLRFASTAAVSQGQDVSLADYLARMKPDQQKIYYITAENIDAAKSSPHIEIFKKNDIEVLLLTDRIDEWVVSHLSEFEGKKLQSVAKGDVDLSDIEAKDKEDDAKTEEKTAQEASYEALLTKIKTLLESQIKDVRLSHRLTSSPACLVRDQNELGPQMERLLKAAGQTVTQVKPTLELNPDHILIQKLQHLNDEAKMTEWAKIIYEQALLAEGSALPDPAAFVKRMNKVWLDMLQ